MPIWWACLCQKKKQQHWKYFLTTLRPFLATHKNPDQGGVHLPKVCLVVKGIQGRDGSMEGREGPRRKGPETCMASTRCKAHCVPVCLCSIWNLRAGLHSRPSSTMSPNGASSLSPPAALSICSASNKVTVVCDPVPSVET